MSGGWVVPVPVGSELPVLALRAPDGRKIGDVLKDEAGRWRYGPFKADRDVDLLDKIDEHGHSVTERVTQALADGHPYLIV
jgi:hypothetical protein